jgi:hypothetical protein
VTLLNDIAALLRHLNDLIEASLIDEDPLERCLPYALFCGPVNALILAFVRKVDNEQ